ncbi:PWWP domain-containing protein 5-like isoform X2 [Henckelia pumila]
MGVNAGSSKEGIKGVNGCKVEDPESKTLVQSSGYPGQVGGDVLADGNKILEESKVFVGEERLVNAKSEIESGEGGSGMGFRMTDRLDKTKNRVVEMMARDDGWGSWGVLNLVGKVLGGKLCMDDEMGDVEKCGIGNDINGVVSDEVEDVKKLGMGSDINSTVGVSNGVEDAKNFGTNHDGNSVVDLNTWQDVFGESVFEDGRFVEETVINTDLDCSLDGAGLSNVKKFGTGNYSIVADEMEDVKNFGTNHDGNSEVDWNAWQNLVGEPLFEDGRAINETAISTDLDSKLGCSREGAGLSEKLHSVLIEQVPDGVLESKGLNNVNSADVLLQRGRGEKFSTEREGVYNASDLVWGKVRSHPWWPGQIFPPSAASDKAMTHFKKDKAMKHLRKDTYLIAYFGDQTFAWNEVSKIKPFRMHFSEMEKQSDTERFCRGVACALDEVARRVELGLSCQCLPKEVHNKIQSQIIQNAGVKEESSVRYGGDFLSTAASFLPGDFLQFFKSLAEAPRSKTDRLQFEIAKAQFLAFSRWKGCNQLLIFQEHGGLLESNAQFTVEEVGRNSQDLVNGYLSNSIDAIKGPSQKRKSTSQDVSSRKRKNLSNDESSKIKKKCIPVLKAPANLSLQDDEKNAVSGMKAVSAGKKRGLVNSISNAKKRQKNMSSLGPSDTCSSRAICGGGESEVLFSARKSTIEEMIPGEFNPDEVLLKLNSAAINPRQGYFILTPIIGLLRQFRNSACLEKSGEEKLFSLEAADLRFEGAKDSYWTDRMIQGYSQEQVTLEPKMPATKDAAGAEFESSIGVTAILDNQKQGGSASLHCEAENSAQVDEGSDEYFQTALLLNFTNLDSIPPVVNLNEIFRRYGPLDETQTKILSKSKRAKVVFLRRADAEAAFSSTGKYSTFGPSLLSYRLHYAASKARATSKGKRNTIP